jgi:hypothetical protein
MFYLFDLPSHVECGGCGKHEYHLFSPELANISYPVLSKELNAIYLDVVFLRQLGVFLFSLDRTVVRCDGTIKLGLAGVSAEAFEALWPVVEGTYRRSTFDCVRDNCLFDSTVDGEAMGSPFIDLMLSFVRAWHEHRVADGTGKYTEFLTEASLLKLGTVPRYEETVLSFIGSMELIRDGKRIDRYK